MSLWGQEWAQLSRLVEILAGYGLLTYEATVVISINIPDGTQRILAEQAALRGQSVESYAAELIRKGVIGGRTFAEILAPFREQVASSDIPDTERDELFEAARNEVHDANQGRQ